MRALLGGVPEPPADGLVGGGQWQEGEEQAPARSVREQGRNQGKVRAGQGRCPLALLQGRGSLALSLSSEIETPALLAPPLFIRSLRFNYRVVRGLTIFSERSEPPDF